ncbi:MAG: hypothetical protein Q8Q59_15860 [Luteolibacter sp.]|nr:hypothetical protein [Luteolibacter sp.]
MEPAYAGAIVAVILGLLCLRRRRRPSDEAMHTLKRRQTASHWLGKDGEQ